ncbi:MAG: hypothetical protein KAT16_02165 [Candidatus Heimdallarchaeota archaeon]|nr:hypothetical protein [Candidatus Heimdallarchaeota archaeon]
MIKRNQLILFFFVVFGLVLLFIPPLIPASYTIENTKWNGVSQFNSLLQSNNLSTSETTIPLRLQGDISKITDIIIIVGGNLPYFVEESQFLYDFVAKGGQVVLFEDLGYARVLSSAFGLLMGGIVIDQDDHALNPYQPLVQQETFIEQNVVFPSRNLVFNHAVKVSRIEYLSDSVYRPLFVMNGEIWEDKNYDGHFYKESEKCAQVEIGAMITFPETGGSFTLVGDSAFPTNDMIDREENKEFLSDLIEFISREGRSKVIFDESRKIWLIPTGKAIYSLLTVLIMGLFHSPLIAFITLVLIGGILATKKNQTIIRFTQQLKHPFSKNDKVASYAYLQSEEEEVFGRLVKTAAKVNVYRTLLIEELQKAPKLSDSEKRYFEHYLRARFFERNDYEKLSEQLKQIIKDREE